MFNSLKSRILVSVGLLAIIVAVSTPWIGMFWLLIGAVLMSIALGLAIAYLLEVVIYWIMYGEWE